MSWVIKIIKKCTYIERKQVFTESKQLSSEDLKAAEHLHTNIYNINSTEGCVQPRV